MLAWSTDQRAPGTRRTLAKRLERLETLLAESGQRVLKIVITRAGGGSEKIIELHLARQANGKGGRGRRPPVGHDHPESDAPLGAAGRRDATANRHRG
jgi:hypothetical protein